MGRPYDGVNSARLIWSMVEESIELPSASQRTSATLALRVGLRSAGWSWRGHRGERAGPALDLTGATAKLRAQRFPQRRAILPREQLTWSDSMADIATSGVDLLFTVAGVIGDPLEGEVSFALEPAHLDAAGRYVFEPEITLADGSVIVPRLFKIELVPRVSA